ncbi:MAG TPA: sigma factor-like helix-turn-helix DNA-binding protein [Bacillota bacterium]|nr:sigma factor-like helix-turn-helix DNA-binding protein [Bacillota bacterium]
MKKLIQEYRESLRILCKGKVTSLYCHSMISDTQWAIKYMETGNIPGSKWTVARWSKEDREILFDPQVLDRCFRIPDAAPEVSEGVRLMLEHLLSCLSPREREAFVLIHGQGFSYQQTADFMGLSKGSVYNLIKRAEKKFSIYREFVGRKQDKGEEVC